MTGPITCPECDGAGVEILGVLHLACRFCGGRGWVDGEHEPAEAGEGPPPVWEHGMWRDPMVSSVLKCRRCLGSGVVVSVDRAARRLARMPCSCRR